MTNWIDIASADALAPGGRLPATAGGRRIVVFRTDEALFAVADVCPHAGQPLQDGELRGCVLTCAYHGFAYDLRTGRNVDYPHDELPARVYPVRAHDGRLEVQMPA
ncbi:MAG: Rieske 2Fe-2S domain-containing protein [Phycisphaeraceae bacterium]